MVEAVVEYDYIAQEPDELTIHKGDVIRNIIQKKGGWWEGTLRDKRGMFPDNFVTVIQKESKLRPKPNRIRQCRAIFSYHPAHDDELNLAAGDIIDIVCEVEEGWWKGRLGSLEGVFPSNFVHEIDPDKPQSKSNSKEDLTNLAGENDSASPSLPPKPTRIVCQAKYPYDALNDDELTLREGDLITLISKDGQDRGWWRGELRGRIGVFPDNFVIVLPIIDQNGPDYEYIKAEKKLEKASHKNSSQSSTAEEVTAKPQNVASQRKSLELKTDDHKAPPVPGKKPNVPKKSPSSAGSSSAMANLKQKLVDMVDGQGNSRAANHQLGDAECDFDQVERTAMLPDMRANRVKAPGRRPPSVVYRETEPPTLLNGNADHVQPMSLSETSNDEDEGEKKPKVREWEKHKAPWVEELKLNQAKRTPPLTPGATDHSRLKLTPTSDKGASPSDNDVPESKVKSPFAHDKESSPVDMTKSMSALSSTKLKTTPTSDTTPDKSPTSVALRMKSVNPPISTTPNRPQSIHGVNVTNLSAHMPPNSQSPSPSAKPPVAEKLNIDTKLAVASSPRPSIEKKEFVTVRQYSELQERLVQMDTRMQQMFHEMQSTIEELKGKLQVETDMRRLLQAELEKVAQCVTQV